MTPATATPAAALTPHRGSGLGQSSDCPQERIASTAEEVEYPELHMQPGTVPMGSNVIREQPVAFVLGKRRGTQTNVLSRLGKILHQFKRRQAPNVPRLQPK